jgi:predicted TIM-barrel fold metal-dependent hydrolase
MVSVGGPIIDSHAHVSSPDLARYPRSNALSAAPQFEAPLEQLLQSMDGAGVASAVLIQPSMYAFDHAYLLKCLAAHPGRFVGVVLGDPGDPDHPAVLSNLVRRAPIRGVRFAPLIDPARPWFGRESDGLTRAIADLKLAACLLVGPAHLEAARQWIVRHPDVTVIIDHLGRPDLNPSDPLAVCDAVAGLAKHPNVVVKLSALVELSREPFPHRDIAAWVEKMNAAFGPERMMWGSDFPHVAGSAKFLASLTSLEMALASLSSADFDRIVGGNARKYFRLP